MGAQTKEHGYLSSMRERKKQNLHQILESQPYDQEEKVVNHSYI